MRRDDENWYPTAKLAYDPPKKDGSLSAVADWDRGLGQERRPDRFSLWAFVASLAGLVLISVGVGLGLTVGC